MTILVDATPLQSEHRMRGVGTYVYYLTRELVRLNPDLYDFFCLVTGQTISTGLG